MIEKEFKVESMLNKEYISIRGGVPLVGEVAPDGAKNSALIHLAATCLLDDGWVTFNNLPMISDVHMSLKMLEEAGFKYQVSKNSAKIYGRATKFEFSEQYGGKIRASLAFLGSVLPRLGEIHLPVPGGDKIGERPIDIHIDILEAFGAETKISGGMIHSKVKELPLKGTEIYLRFPSVLATVNGILLGVLAQGQTVLRNVAKEPEIVDLVSFLSKMGAKIVGAGTDTIFITGVESLHSAEHEIVPDRLETGALIMAFVMSGGKGTVKDIIPEHIMPMIHTLRSCGVDLSVEVDRIHINKVDLKKNFRLETKPYPGFATDLQPIITPLALACPEGSVITDTIFKERFAHIEELRKMGANIERTGNTVRVISQEPLVGSKVSGGDIRSVVCMINAGLAAEGETKVYGIEHLARGHVDFIDKLQKLNADIELV